MRLIVVTGVLLTSLTLPSAAQTLCATSAAACQPELVSTLKNVFEQLKGANNGTNQQFSLGSLPDPSYPVHVFKNGIELTSSSYSIEGSTVAIRPSPTTFAGDIYEAAYKTRVTGHSATQRRARGLGAKPSSPIIDAYLTRSLRAELGVDASQATSVTEALPRPDPLYGAESPAGPLATSQIARNYHGVPASLRLLSRALQQNKPRQEDGKRSRGLLREKPADLHDFQHVADRLVPSPFDYLASQPGALDDVLSTADRTESRSLSSTHPVRQSVPGSLKMLSDRLDGQQ